MVQGAISKRCVARDIIYTHTPILLPLTHTQTQTLCNYYTKTCNLT